MLKAASFLFGHDFSALVEGRVLLLGQAVLPDRIKNASYFSKFARAFVTLAPFSLIVKMDVRFRGDAALFPERHPAAINRLA